MLIFVVLIICLALFCGWSLGPKVSSFLQKFSDWDKKSVEDSKKEWKKYSMKGYWFTHPDIWDHRGAYIKAILIVLVIAWWFIHRS